MLGDGFADAATFAPASGSLLEVMIAFIALANAALFVLNIIPAFPLDGGRIARAVAWKLSGNRHKATKFSAYMGQGFAVLMMGYGVYVLAAEATRPRRPLVDRAGLDARRRGPRRGRPEHVRHAPGGHHGGRHHGRRAGRDPGRDLPSRAPTTSSSCATRAGRGSRSSRTTGTSPGSPTAPRSSTPRCRRTPQLPVRAVVADAEQVRTDTPLESLIGSEPLRRLGALMAVDAEGRLRGVVTLEQVSRGACRHGSLPPPSLSYCPGPCPRTTC